VKRTSRAAKLVCVSAFAAALLAASGASASTTAPSEFTKEQAMSSASLIERWTPLIKEASRRFKIAEDWIKAVMRMESGGRTQLEDGKPITSKKGAMGVMQVMPDTYKDMRAQYGLGADPYNPHDNVLAGAAYLHWLYEKYGYPKMFAAYNAGPKTIETDERHLPDETRAYVSGIARLLGTKFPEFENAKALPPEPVDPNATFTRPDGTPVLIEAATVSAIRAAMENEYAPGVQTVLAMGEKRQGVTEDLATVASLLKAHGGKI
jgi:membrane-bound lytic murein transglycosylase B